MYHSKSRFLAPGGSGVGSQYQEGFPGTYIRPLTAISAIEGVLRSNLAIVWDLIHYVGLIPNLEKFAWNPTHDFGYVGMYSARTGLMSGFPRLDTVLSGPGFPDVGQSVYVNQRYVVAAGFS